jgi:hydroxymethylpyrimidine pyrophosphatase-like HAD family hydrolase
VTTTGPLVVTDLDGTLWGNDLVVRPGTRAAVARLAAAGIPVLAATARRVRGARELLVRNELSLPVVGLNGALGERADGSRFHDAPFAPADAAAALAAFERHGMAPCVYVIAPEVDVLLPPAPATNPGHVAYLEPVARTVPDLRAAVAAEPIYGFSVLGRPPAELEPVLASLRAAGIPSDFAPEPLWPGWSVTAMPVGVSKWAGVLAYCAAEGLSSAAVLAAGDGTNDLPMLEAAARPFVVAGSRAAVRLPAAESIAPPEEDGWAELAGVLGAGAEAA